MSRPVSHVLAPFVYRRKIGGLCLDAEVTLLVEAVSCKQALHDAGVSFCCRSK